MKERFTAIGLMSGTSMDGIDIALLHTDGRDEIERGPALEVAYSSSFRKRLASALDDAKSISRRADRPGNLADIEREITLLHAEAVARFMRENKIASSDVQVIGFHGQTVLHRPLEGLTVQIGDGALLARETGIPVVYDMRANDMIHGGEGAPLVPVYHAALARNLPQGDFPVVFVNIGGISNLTSIEADGTLIAFDSGPGNTLIDQWVEGEAGIPFDQGGAIASEGHVIAALAKRYLDHPFFEGAKRRSLDRNDFRPPEPGEAGLHDGARTLAHVTAAAILKSAGHLPQKPKRYVICGGGRLNRIIIDDLRNMAGDAGAEVLIADNVGFNGGSMEAEAWAYLAVRSLKGLPLTFPGTTGVSVPVTGGILAEPKAADLVLLQTTRLSFAPWDASDVSLLVAMHATPETSRFVGNNQPWTQDYALGRLNGWLEARRSGQLTQFKIVARDDGRFIGRAGINRYSDDGVYQISYSIAPDEWGAGFASEIALGLSDWFFRNGLGERLQAFADKDNLASIRVLQKTGMQEIESRTVHGTACRFFEIHKSGRKQA